METRHFGNICYRLTRKRVKNINMRVDSKGSLNISAPRFVPISEIEGFILHKTTWINAAIAQRIALTNAANAPVLFSKEQCLEEFCEISNKIFPLFADILNGEKPIIKARAMKTRWGVCHIQKRIITLNMRLLEKPREAREYVVLHEYVHFLHADHGKGFYQTLTTLMPDYKARRALLK